MNEFRMSLLKERADAIRPDLTKARKMIEAAEAEHRDLTDEEKAFTEPVLKSARDVADNMAKTRDEDAAMKAINDEFADVTGGLSHDEMSSSGSPSKSRRLSFKGMGAKVATHMLGVDGTKAVAPSGATVVGDRRRGNLEPPAITQRDGGVLIQGARRPRHTVQGTFHLMWEQESRA